MESIHTNFEFTKLEFNKILEKVSRYANTKYGCENILSSAPSVKKDLIIYNFNLLEDLRKFINNEESLTLSKFYNISELIILTQKKIVLTAINLFEIAVTLKNYFYLKKRFSNEKYPTLNNFLTITNIKDTFYLEILKYIKSDGYIESKATSELFSIREKISQIDEKIRKTSKDFYNEQKNLGYTSDHIVSIRDGFECVAIKSNYKARVEGIVLDYSQTGQTVYVVPNKVLELHNQLIMARNEELEEIRKILKFYSEKVNDNSNELFVIDKEILDFDILHAKTRFAIDNRYNIPKINDSRIIKISDGRHPLIGEKAVPLNLTMGEDFKILIITGPNTGGKTVVLKTVDSFPSWLQCGIPIPATTDSQFCIFDKIFVDIGDEQSIENSLSTFSGHIKKIIYILTHSTKNSLVLLDELCAGTDPIEGSALAIGILKELKNIGLMSIVSTHYGELKNFASKEASIENGSMEFDNNTLAPTYRLLTGVPGSSKALEISKRLGLSEKILNEAKNNINPYFLDSEKLLGQLEEKNIKLTETESRLLDYENKLNEKENELILKKNQLKEKEKELDRLLKSKESEFLKESRREFEELIKEIKTSNADKGKIIEGKIFFEKVKTHVDSQNEVTGNDTDFTKGDFVKILSNGNEGYIINKSNNTNEYIVQVGIVKLNIKSSDLVKIVNEEDENDRLKNSLSSKISFTPEKIGLSLDIRGFRYEEAERKLDEFVSNSLAGNNKTIRVIHGKGSGALRKCIQDYFTHSPFVVNFDFEKDSNSGVNYGITIAQLR